MVRGFLLVSGTICLGLGLVGVILPLVPTTPFLLLAVVCYANSSRRLHVWILRHPWFGREIRNFRRDRAISLGSKLLGIAMLWVSIGTSAALVQPSWAKLVLVGIAGGVTGYLLSLKTLRK